MVSLRTAGQQEQSGSEGRLVLIETRVGLVRQRHFGSMAWYQGEVGTATELWKRQVWQP